MYLTEYETTGRIEGANVVTLTPSADGVSMAVAAEFADGTGAWTDGLTTEYALLWARATVAEHHMENGRWV